MEKRKLIVNLILAVVGVILGLAATNLFLSALLMELPLGVRMVTMPLVYWLIAVVPLILKAVNRERCSEYGFTRNRLFLQILTGIGIAFVMSALLTLLPHLIGYGELVSSGKSYQHLWQFLYELFYTVFAIGAVEEFVFRGFFYHKVKQLTSSEITTIIVTSILFGCFHLFSGNIIQMIVTGCIGAVFCICRLKIKNCSTLSLILAHGIYDWLIVVWASVL